MGVVQERKEGWRTKDRRGSCRGTAVVLTALNNAPKEEDSVAENTSIDDCGEGSTMRAFPVADSLERSNLRRNSDLRCSQKIYTVNARPKTA